MSVWLCGVFRNDKMLEMRPKPRKLRLFPTAASNELITGNKRNETETKK